MADFYGVTLSELVKNYSLEQLEDECDRQIAEISYKQWVEDGKQTVSIKEIFDEFENGSHGHRKNITDV